MIYQVEKSLQDSSGTVEVYQIEAKELSDALIQIELEEVCPIETYVDHSERPKFTSFIIRM